MHARRQLLPVTTSSRALPVASLLPSASASSPENIKWTDGPDGSNYNLVTGNKLVPRGSKCVGVKEGATMNVIEYNDCEEQLDDESGCFDSRGNGNIFRSWLENFRAGCSILLPVVKRLLQGRHSARLYREKDRGR